MPTRAVWLVFVLFALSVPAVAAAAGVPCGGGDHDAAEQDAADMRGVRAQVEIACPCASFAGQRNKTFVRCARAVVDDASDGTPIDGRVKLRPECRTTVLRVLRASDCGFVAADQRDPCCEHVVGSGKNRGRIARAAKCTSTAGVVRNHCPSFHFVADACSGNALNTCNTVGTTTSIPSPATPANTPGTTGVTVSNAKLLTQFGGSSVDLNMATYTRFRRDGAADPPDAILILVPGFYGGANDFKILAENVIPRAFIDQGLVLEIWAYDRRTNQLEDRIGLDISEARLDPQIGLDWLFGTELGLALDPVLVAGPNRRAVLYDSTDIPFTANWTPLVFARDIDAVVDAADAAVRNHNVFLGGHSMGTTFTARYASTDFDLTGLGPAQPGYAKLRGLVMLEGGGGTTAGAPLTGDTLDRIIAKADGGLYGAVADPGQPGRCVDGTTACTIATEATDCTGQVPPKCTLTTIAYPIVSIAGFAALNPRISASSEATAIQGATDPDTGLSILAVDQGAAGNNALAKVPDLSGLTIIPKSTVKGGVGSFVDDDNFISSLAPFVATSVGAPGPMKDGLLSWQDIDEGTLPASVLPNNGPPPTAVPAPVWGQEQEVTSLTRLMNAFYAGDTNFTDWYYPSAGLSVTSVSGQCSSASGGTCTVGNVDAACGGSGMMQAQADAQCSQAISLDSTALSVGRGRRDIENLTQAPNVNIPVISFVASNGLARVPGAMTALGTSIHGCTAPSCDGLTDRVVDANNPSAAFPTFGGVPGGFEVYVYEGVAHIDVVTAEDVPSNPVLGPLVDFLKRNVQ